MSSLWLDIRYALRMMAKAKGFTAVVALTLALGIGASTTIFSVVRSIILRPLPYEQPDQLVRIYTEFHGGGKHLEGFAMSEPELDDFRRACRSCQSAAAWMGGTAALAGGDRPVRIDATYATHELLPLLGVQPLLGRFFDATEDRPGDPTVIVLGHAIWQRAFHGDPAIVGKKIYTDAIPVTVIGVMPPGFDFLGRSEAWLPAGLRYAPELRASHNLSVIARLAPGSTLAELGAELAALMTAWSGNALATQHRIDPVDHPMTAVSFQANLVGSLATSLWLLQGAVMIVLVIAIVNIANLLLARSETRTREVAVRHALGASRKRLVRQFVTESVLLGALGGGLGILLAVWAVDGVVALVPASAPRAGEIHLDGAALAFAAACSVGAALLFGLAPILHARRTDLHGALKDGSPRMTGSKARLRVRRSLVIAELALAVVLVVGCLVMVRSFARLQEVELGFRPDHLLTFEVEIPQKNYPGLTGDAFWHRLEDKLRALPGATSATLVRAMPLERGLNSNSYWVPGRPREPQDTVDYWQTVGSDAFATLGTRVVRGRGILPSDTHEAPAVVVINEAFAAKVFPGLDPIGRQLGMSFRSDNTQTVVGVVEDMKQGGVDRPAGTEVYFPIWQTSKLRTPPVSPLTLTGVVRTSGDPRTLVPAVYRAVADLDPALPLARVRTMDDIVWDAVARPRFLTFLLSCFAGLALLLAAVGIYGVMAHTVALRTHEIGLRVALGAQPAQVRRMVLRQAAGLSAVGVAAGIAITALLQLALGPTLHHLFYGASLAQPLLIGAVSAVIALVALAATWIPVRRATSIQPIIALRSE